MTYRRWKIAGSTGAVSRLRKYVTHKGIGKTAWVVGENAHKGYQKKKKGKRIRKGAFAIGLILIFGIYFMGANSALADTFYPSGDTQYCDFAQAISVSYRDLPPVSIGAGGLSYDILNLQGEFGLYPQYHSIFDVAELRYPNARRYNGVADYVAVPPKTTIDIGHFAFNYAGHPISLENGYLFLSRMSPEDGSLGRLGANGIIGEVSFFFYGRHITRSGLMRELGYVGTWDNSSWDSPPSGQVLYSFETIQPMEFAHRGVKVGFTDIGELQLLITSRVRNTSEYSLGSVEFSDCFSNGYQFTNVEDFAPGEEKTFGCAINLGLDYPSVLELSPAVVSDPNRHVESVGRGGDSIINFDPESRVFIAARTDLGATGWLGLQPDFAPVPSGDFLTVELIPYEVYSDTEVIELTPELNVEKLVTDSDEIEVKNNEILAGEEVEYVIRIGNSGARARNVRIIDDYDERYLEVLDDGEFVEENGRLILDIEEIRARESIELKVKMKAKELSLSGDYKAINKVKFECEESYCGQEDQVETTIKFGGLRLSKFVWDGANWRTWGSFSYGDTVNFQLLVENLEGDRPKGVKISDKLRCLPDPSVKHLYGTLFHESGQPFTSTKNFVTKPILNRDGEVVNYDFDSSALDDQTRYKCINEAWIDAETTDSDKVAFVVNPKVFRFPAPQSEGEEQPTSQGKLLGQTGFAVSPVFCVALFIFFFPLSKILQKSHAIDIMNL